MTWEPATDTERRMQDVLRQGDQEGYFLLLSGVDLFIPVAPGNAAWATWSTEDRTHVLAFTSESALRSCLREHAGQHRRVRLEELVHGWPDEEWWLAVNPGLPIEGYLPAWFVAQVSKGDVSLPRDEPEPEPPAYGGFGFDGYRADAPSAFTPPPPPAAPREDTGTLPRRSLVEPREDEDYHYGQNRASTFGPAPEPVYAPEPSFGSSFGSEPEYRVEAAYTPQYQTPEPRVRTEDSYADYAPPAQLPPLPEERELPFRHGGYSAEPGYAPDPPAYTPDLPAYTPEAPAYTPEPEYRRDSAFGQELPYRSEPAYAPEPESAYRSESAYAPEPEPPYRSDFTPAPASTYPAEPYNPEPPAYQLEPAYAPESAYNPPEPAYDAPDSHRPEPTSSHGVTAESAYAEPSFDRPSYGEPKFYDQPVGYQEQPASLPDQKSLAVPGSTGDDIEGELAAAGAAGDTPRFLNALLSGWVYVPLNDGAPEGIRPGDPGFRWRTDLIDGAYSLTVFTSPTRMARRLGPCEFVKVTFVRVARNWPDRSYSLAINPGTEVGANMPGTQMQTLLSWAERKNLLEAAEEMEREADPYAARRDESLSAGGSLPSELQQRKLGPTLMQKLIPAAQVPFYLQRGYDRIAGFVHPAEDLADFDAPETLRASLGLPHDGASDVYVIRWISHRADLYRIPYGGNDEDEMRRMEGWVIEPAPFRGNGFAPGDNGSVVAEFKVDSIRLPHGATMHRLSSIDGDTLVASYDADQQTWLTAEETL